MVLAARLVAEKSREALWGTDKHESHMQNARLEEAQAGIKSDRSKTSDTQMTAPLWQKVKKN